MDTNAVLYPLGVQTFDKLIDGGYFYVDKTEYVYRMTHMSSSYIFLSRPRRFGKSLLMSTLHCYFEGRKDLFKGLAIEKLEKEWVQYPVLHFDMSTAKHMDKNELELELGKKLSAYEKVWGRNEEDVRPNQRLEGLIERAHKQTGQKVVLLIDEYDAPLLDVVHEDEHLRELRNVMRNFYSPIKACDPHLRFVFLTGITKFSQVSIFSELNNLYNISMDEEFAGICGITEDEMLTCMDVDITNFARKNGMTHDEAVEALKDNYDGYHFTWPSPDVYNPFSLLNALQKNKINSYWYVNTPTYLVEMLRQYKVTPAWLGQSRRVTDTAFDAPLEGMTDITPLLYHSGYLTIKDCVGGEIYTLDIPNREIRKGLMEGLLPHYLGETTNNGKLTTVLMRDALLRDDIDEMFSLLKTFLGTIPYVDSPDDTRFHESHWQQMLFAIFSLMGARCDLEVRTSNGRIDLVATTATTLYLIELKLNKSAQAAMNQIDLKNYDKRFALYNLPVVKVGVNFDLAQKNITDWKIER